MYYPLKAFMALERYHFSSHSLANISHAFIKLAKGSNRIKLIQIVYIKHYTRVLTIILIIYCIQLQVYCPSWDQAATPSLWSPEVFFGEFDKGDFFEIMDDLNQAMEPVSALV